MKYDPNWLQKERIKVINRQLSQLSHVEDPNAPKFQYSTMLCGKGWGAKGHPSITTVSFPSVSNLPTCRTCREKFLASIGVEFDEKGYPLTVTI